MYPVWSRAGDDLFYRQGRTIYAVTVRGGARPVADSPRALFEGPFLTAYDVARDGRFLMVRSDASTMPERLHVVLNWTQELSRVAPSGK